MVRLASQRDKGQTDLIGVVTHNARQYHEETLRPIPPHVAFLSEPSALNNQFWRIYRILEVLWTLDIGELPRGRRDEVVVCVQLHRQNRGMTTLHGLHR